MKYAIKSPLNVFQYECKALPRLFLESAPAQSRKEQAPLKQHLQLFAYLHSYLLQDYINTYTSCICAYVILIGLKRCSRCTCRALCQPHGTHQTVISRRLRQLASLIRSACEKPRSATILLPSRDHTCIQCRTAPFTHWVLTRATFLLRYCSM